MNYLYSLNSVTFYKVITTLFKKHWTKAFNEITILQSTEETLQNKNRELEELVAELRQELECYQQNLTREVSETIFSPLIISTGLSILSYPAYEPPFVAFEIPGVEFNDEEEHDKDDVSLEGVRTAVEEISATVTEFWHTATSIIDTKAIFDQQRSLIDLN